eukprot:Em0002g677a
MSGLREVVDNCIFKHKATKRELLLLISKLPFAAKWQELFAIMAAARTWGHLWTGLLTHFHCDNLKNVAIHDEQPLQMHSEDVFHAEQQPTADIDDSSDDVEDIVDDDDDDPDIVEWFGHTTSPHCTASVIRFWFCTDGQAGNCCSSCLTPLKARADGKRVMMLPLILFSDDTSGNRSKKWHKVESWYLSFAGLPRHLNARIENINFVCSSDSVSPLDLSEPITQQLTALETEGVFNTFDASHQETVLVVAPLMCIVCDNPRASVLLNHLGSAALKHCPRCMTTRQKNPVTVCALRTKDMALQQIAQINALLTEADRVGMRKSFGLGEDYNPLLYIPADLYLSIPVDILHTLSLGSCKHFLKDVMPKMSPHQKREIQARVKAFNTSGFSTKLHGSVCYYYQSFVGRAFKGWTQMALFILGPYLSDGQKEVLLAYSKNMAIPFLDHILFNLDSRFSPLSTTATSLLTLVPAIICARNVELDNAIKVYHDDLPSPELVPQEIIRWKLRYEKQ